VLPTESAAYQTAAYQDEGVKSELQQLVEALPFAESLEDFASIVEDSPREAVEEAIALQDTQPRRQQLMSWYEKLANDTSEPLQLELTWLDSAVKLLQEALAHGSDTVRAVLAGWEFLDQCEAVETLGEKSPTDLQRLLAILDQWAALGEKSPTNLQRLLAIVPDWVQWCG
jgi:hypothetical protein